MSLADSRMNAHSDVFPLTSQLPFQAMTSPILSRVRFAEIIGVSEGVVIGWCNKGLLETFKIGKHSLINMEALRRQCDQRTLG